MPKKITKTKKVSKRPVRRPNKREVVLKASTLGIAEEYVLAPILTPAMPVSVPAQPQPPLICTNFKRPLVGPQTSFWLGVGFGIFVIGVLGYLAVRLFQVELAEAVVVGLTQSL